MRNTWKTWPNYNEHLSSMVLVCLWMACVGFTLFRCLHSTQHLEWSSIVILASVPLLSLFQLHFVFSSVFLAAKQATNLNIRVKKQLSSAELVCIWARHDLQLGEYLRAPERVERKQQQQKHRHHHHLRGKKTMSIVMYYIIQYRASIPLPRLS